MPGPAHDAGTRAPCPGPTQGWLPGLACTPTAEALPRPLCRDTSDCTRDSPSAAADVVRSDVSRSRNGIPGWCEMAEFREKLLFGPLISGELCDPRPLFRHRWQNSRMLFPPWCGRLDPCYESFLANKPDLASAATFGIHCRNGTQKLRKRRQNPWQKRRIRRTMRADGGQFLPRFPPS